MTAKELLGVALIFLGVACLLPGTSGDISSPPGQNLPTPVQLQADLNFRVHGPGAYPGTTRYLFYVVTNMPVERYEWSWGGGSWSNDPKLCIDIGRYMSVTVNCDVYYRDGRIVYLSRTIQT